MKESRSNLILTQALLVSGALNMLFIALFYFIIVQEAPLYFTFRQIKAAVEAKESDTATSQLLTRLNILSMDELIPYLDDQTQLEEGIKTRDIALAILTDRHHFDLSRALLGFPEPAKKSLKIAGPEITYLTLYINLSDSHYRAITDFAKQELFPVTDAPLAVLPPLEVVEKEKPKTTHIVQEGESLWKISRLHKVDVDVLRTLNNLRSDQIKPGQVLIMP